MAEVLGCVRGGGNRDASCHVSSQSAATQGEFSIKVTLAENRKVALICLKTRETDTKRQIRSPPYPDLCKGAVAPGSASRC